MFYLVTDNARERGQGYAYSCHGYSEAFFMCCAVFIERCIEVHVQEEVRQLALRDGEGQEAPPRSRMMSSSDVPTVIETLPPQTPLLATLSRGVSNQGDGTDATFIKTNETANGGVAGAAFCDLPPNWIAVSDDEGDYFFLNSITGETTWIKPVLSAIPAALPPCWIAETDSDGDVFYYNSATGEKTWTRPTSAGLPNGWTAVADDEGDYFYLHEASGVTTWTRPVKSPPEELCSADLPSGWRTETDDVGDVFFVHESGLSSWTRPSADGSIPDAAVT
jgi:hypothetical protein